MRDFWALLHVIRALVVWMVVLAVPQAVQASAPLAGSQVKNQAVAEFLDPNIKRTVTSNEVVVSILPVPSATLSNDHLDEVAPGTTFVWPHDLVNTGNVADSYRITAADVGGDNGEFAQIRVVHDLGCDGVANASDPVIATGGTVSLAAGARACLLVIIQTPSSALEGDRYRLSLGAISVTDPAIVLSRADEAVINGPLIELTKQVSAATARQGDELLYTLSITNRNNLPAPPLLASIDGAVVPRIIVDDPIPANVRLARVPVYPGPGTVIYHVAETAPGLFVTTPPANLARVDRIGIAYTTYPGKQSDQLKFATTVLANAVQTTLSNQYRFLYHLGDTDREVFSPTVETVVSEAGKTPTLVNKDSSYADLALRIGLGQELFLEATCSACNTESGRRDYLVIRVRSGNNPENDGVRNAPLVAFYDALGKDEVIVTAYETGPNTGVFRVVAFGEDTSKTETIGIPTHNYTGGDVERTDNVLETVRHDLLIANILYCLNPDLSHGKNVNVSANVLVDPFGVVFDSSNNVPVAGAQVTLVRLIGGVEAPSQTFIYDDNGRQCSPTRDPLADPDCKGTVITVADGKYRFPLVEPGDYILKITPPATHLFPSNVAIPASFTRVIVVGSRGEIFTVTPGRGPVEIDVPLDPQLATAALFVRKSGNRSTVEQGDFVDYTINVRNAGKATAQSVNVEDRMPSGFSYVTGSARVDSVAMEPVQAGGVIRFNLGNLTGGTERVIRYRLRAGAIARGGDAVNQATAFEDIPAGSRSNTATYKVRVIPGVFSAEAYITGKVYTDCNRDGVQGLEEVGVPGVRIYLEDGTFVVTDVEGKFDFYGLRPKTHVLKIDRTTLPRDIELVEQSVRNGGDPASRFADLKASEIHRADFAVTSGTGTCEGPGMEEIFQRRADGDKVGGELERNLKMELPVIPVTVSDVRSLPASGCLTGGDSQCGVHGKAAIPELSEALAPAPEAKGGKTQLRELETYLTETDRRPAFLNLKDGDILPMTQTPIQVKGTLGATMTLTVNGEEVPFKRVGKRITVQDTRIEGREYIGVKLNPGPNTLELKQVDAMGNPRGSVSITVVAPGALEAIKLLAPSTRLEANGESRLPINLILHDRDGVPVTSRTPVTVEASAGRILEKDLDPKQPGTQLFVEGGETVVTLVAPTTPGEGDVQVRSGILKESVHVKFVPELRPLVASGIVEGMISLKDFDIGKVTPAMAADGFEDELHSLASANDGKLNTGARAALFLKGKVKGEYLLTMSYDSDKARNQSLFRDIRPEDYYPVYGDSAVKGFDAQSTSKLYVRVDKGRSNALFGDYNTRIDNAPGLELGQYSRSLTGVRVHHETENSSVTGFVAQTDATQVTLEIPALGVSGPYVLPGVSDMLVNSEKVEILLRDRNNPGLIISSQSQSRFTDYEFEPLTGSLIFKGPVPSLDPSLNPYSIRVTLEVGGNGPEYWVGGVQGQHKLSERLTVGAAAVSEDNPADAYQLGSVNAVYKLTADTRITVEGASSDRESKGAGAAGRVEVVHEKGTDYWRLFHGESEKDFDNTAAPLNAGRTESGGRLRLSLGSWGLFRGEATRTADANTNGVRQGLKLSLEKRLNEILALEVGSRIYDETRKPASSSSLGATPYEGVTAWLKANVQHPKLPGASAFVEYEQDVDNSDRQILSLGGDYRMGSQGRVYARHELISSLSGGNGLNDTQQRNTTVAGFEDEYMKDGRVFSEYRVRDAISATESEAAIGLRNRWYLAEDVRLNTSLERTSTLKGNGNNDATAVSLGLEYLANPLWKATGKVDLRWADTADTILNQLGLAWKLDRDWTLLARNTFNLTDNKKTGDKLLDRFQLGFAWRQVDINRWDALTKIEYKLEDDQSQTTAVDRDAVIFSTHVNYHPVRRLTLSGNYAGKWAKDHSGGIDSDSTTHMVGARAIRDLTERWEASVQAGQIWGDAGMKRYVAGIESGYMVMANFWVSAGYNFLSYDDGDLVGNDYTVDGFYLRFRFKFDEDLFNARKPGINKTLEPDHVRP